MTAVGQQVLELLTSFKLLARRRAEGERWRQEAGKLVRSLPNLNRSQKEAVAKAIFRRFTLWQVSAEHLPACGLIHQSGCSNGNDRGIRWHD